MGRFADRVEKTVELPYRKIPYFPRTTVEGHRGALVFGELAGRKVACLVGRVHYYEGLTMAAVVLPIRVLGLLGVKVFILSNAAGGLNPKFRRGDIMAITDHINLMGDNPLRGPNDKTYGPRFPSLVDGYDRELLALARSVAKRHRIDLQEGVYAALAGPSLETKAEYRFLAQIGADAVGMSTVPEVIAARHMGMKVLAFSVITNLGLEDTTGMQSAHEVEQVAEQTAPRLQVLIENTIGAMSCS